MGVGAWELLIYCWDLKGGLNVHLCRVGVQRSINKRPRQVLSMSVDQGRVRYFWVWPSLAWITRYCFSFFLPLNR